MDWAHFPWRGQAQSLAVWSRGPSLDVVWVQAVGTEV